MTPMQQIFLGLGAKKKTYVDDVFSTYLWNGSGSNRSINNGIDFSGEGGLAWIKSRSDAEHNWLFDTVNGADWAMNSDRNNTRYNTGSPYMSSFNSNGFSLGDHDGVNDAAMTYSSWSFRKAPGFFDIVVYTGNGTAGHNISHSLGCVPGCIIVKSTSNAQSWQVYHRDLDGANAGKAIFLDLDNASQTNSSFWNNTAPTATQFTVGTDQMNNGNGETYVAYLFAGGESTASEARSVIFDGGNDGNEDYLTIPNDTDFNLGSDNFTIETWFKPHISATSYNCWWSYGDCHEFHWRLDGTAEKIQASFKDSENGNYVVELIPTGTGTARAIRGVWHHVAVVRNGNNFNLYLNGTSVASATYSGSIGSPDTEPGAIGAFNPTNSGSNYPFYGELSNFRLVKGTAVYTSSFKPLYKPLTNITNTKLLCCNNEVRNGSTVTPGTITAEGNPTASTNSPFDDPEGFVFGDSGDQNLIKCGSYEGANAATRHIHVGFEPQWILIKNIDLNEGWVLVDTMRGLPVPLSNTANVMKLFTPDSTSAEVNQDFLNVNETGFVLRSTNDRVNGSYSYVYMAIRRPDGYVGKPIETGTDAFNVVYGNSSSTIPNFPGNFPVDMGIYKEPASSYDWYLHTRKVGHWSLRTNSNSAENTNNDSDATFDSNVGWGKFGYNTDKASWLWRRHAGLDVVTYKANGVAGHQIQHNLSKTPEMIWVKDRENTRDWRVFHHGLNGGSNPAQYGIKLNSTDAESQNSSYWNDTAPDSISFTIGNSNNVNDNGQSYIAMLFASISGVSAVGSYTGNNTSGSPNTQEITVGFQPRFIMIKKSSGTGDWRVLDSVRGWPAGSTVDPALKFNSNAAQDSGYNLIEAIGSTSFTLSNSGLVNANGAKFIYYAHA